jgi:tetratricopeptide (TPR) repeat protein
VRDWKRALRLYNRAEELLDPTDLQLMRGQFRYLLVYGPEIELELDSLWWEPKAYGPDDAEQLLFLFLSGLGPKKPKTLLSESDRDTLRDAANDLEKALNRSQSIAPVYHAVLARCYFSIGRFREAATQYARVLNSQLVTLPPVLRKPFYRSLTAAYRAGGEVEKAIGTLEQLARDLPEEKGIYLQVAELQAEMADFDSMLIAIRKEEERNPEVNRDWRVTSLLALGETRDVSKELLSALKSDEEVYHSTVALLKEYWHAYASLSDKGQEEWTAASLLWNSLPGKPMRSTWLRQAALFYALAVEIELRARFFIPFRDRVRSAPEELTLAQQGVTDKDVGIFCRFIVSADGALTLLQMANILSECNRPQKPILKAFRGWLGPAHSVLVKQVPVLLEIGAFRNTGTHKATSTTTLESIPGWCRSVIESLIQADRNLGPANIR